MSKLIDIKRKIDQLDGGTFQNLCDAYLGYKGYKKGYALGMVSGTSKTAKGNPDTYFLTPDKQFVFVMYTTQKDNFVKKIREDIQKCFDSEKTGLAPEHIAEIIICHTYGRLSAGEHQNLLESCERYGTTLTLISLDELAWDLYVKYPRLAMDFLGETVDTGQINSLKDFIIIHDKNKMSAPLSTSFMFRESELEDAKTKLTQSNVLIISGPAGTGKTRLALKLCEDSVTEQGYEILCVKSNHLELYDDLAASIEIGKNYLVFVDDANELTGLHFILDYLSGTAIGQKSIHKIILTVRDYAQREVVNQVLKAEKPEFLKIGLLKDEQIKKLLTETFEITNPLYLNRIAAIAEGNARLAMLAGKLASNANTLESIRDASELYRSYYEGQIQTITNSETGLISAGIIAFFQALHLDHLKHFAPIFSAFKITEDQFISDLHQLHSQELVDLCHDKAVRISDQSFGNYLIKYVFVDKKLIPFSQMIEYSFFINKMRTISACTILLNIFSDDPLQEYIEQQIIVAWDHLRSDTENFPAFFNSFHMVRPTETLVILKEQIDQTSPQSYDIHSIVFDKHNGEKNISDDIIKILCGFANHPQLPEAIDLLLQYYQKRPDLFEQVYTVTAFHFGVNQYSSYNDYYTQTLIVNRLCAEVQVNPSDENLFLFVRTAEEFLKLAFSRTEEGRNNSITFYTMPLSDDPAVIEYRRLLLEQLLNIYKSKKCCNELESLLKDYCLEYKTDVCHEIIRQEFDLILQFFSLLSANNLYHCIIANHIQEIAQYVNYDCGETLSAFLSSRKLKIYNSLNVDHSVRLSHNFENRAHQHRTQVCKLVERYGPSEFQELFQICRESLEFTRQNHWSLSQGVSFAIDTFSKDKSLYPAVVKAYIDADTPYEVHADVILQNLFRIMPPEEIKNLLLSADFAQQNAWLWAFYTELPEDQISSEWTDDLLLYLQAPAKDLHRSPYRPLDRIKKYERAEINIFLKAGKIIISHYDESPFIFNLYFSPLLDPEYMDTSELIRYYKDDISLLENIYLKCILSPDNADYEGTVLSEIIIQNPCFLHRYLDEFLKQIPPYLDYNNAWLKRLGFIWKQEDFLAYMDDVAEYLEKMLKGTRIRYSSVLNHLLTPESEDTDTASKQELWIQTTIERKYTDEQSIYHLFCAVAEQGPDRRKNALKRFLELNSDYALFEKLPLLSLTYTGWGSLIPNIQRRIDYLNSLLPMLTGATFLKHRKKVEEDIESLKEYIKSEEVRELLESLG